MIQCNKDGPLPEREPHPFLMKFLAKASCRITVSFHSGPSDVSVSKEKRLQHPKGAAVSGVTLSRLVWAPALLTEPMADSTRKVLVFEMETYLSHLTPCL